MPRTPSTASVAVTPSDVSDAVSVVESVFGDISDVSTPQIARSLFATLADGADETDGRDLERDKMRLIDIPHVITRLVFRKGKGKGENNYVSVEAVIADADTLRDMVRRGRLSAEQAHAVTPNEKIVYNDSSTGVCRQLVAYAVAKGLVSVPDGSENGAAGASRYDTYHELWELSDQCEREFSAEGKTTTIVPARLLVKRGLRVSEYENEDGENRTFYLA